METTAPKLNKAQAAYNLLLMLSVVDGNIAEAERTVIQRFVAEQHPEPVNFSEEEDMLLTLESDDLMRHFSASAELFFASSSPRERVDLLLTGVELVMADGKMSVDEHKIFRALAQSWGLKFEALVAKYTQQAQHRDQGRA